MAERKDNINGPGGAFEQSITIEELLRRHPELITVFNRYDLHCVGCLLARFHDIGEAASEHGIDEDALLVELLATVSGDE